jgi:hypothetical protein
MTNLFIAILAAVLVSVHVKLPFMLMHLAKEAQIEFDTQISTDNSCRSTFEESKFRKFSFSEQTELPCYFERIDFGALETRGHWPKSVCLILEQLQEKPYSIGAETCNYQ